MIFENKIMCLKCDTIIESTHRYDFKWCKCKSVAIDGGHAYLKRAGEPNSWKDLSSTSNEFSENEIKEPTF